MLQFVNKVKPLSNLSYQELEEYNLEIQSLRHSTEKCVFLKEALLKYLSDDRDIKVIIVCFSDLEGTLRTISYNKEYLIKNYSSLTFDGSSVRGFSKQSDSDLCLSIDWLSFYFVPTNLFGSNKMLVFANVCNRDGSIYSSDFRGRLQNFLDFIYKKQKIVFNIAPEIEGFLLKGIDVEQSFFQNRGFEFVTNGGYYNSLPQDPLRLFIDQVSEVHKSLGFKNEKDHAEVAPSQFELNYQYTQPVEACDRILLYKIICRQIAKNMGFTASFLPKPFININGSGMHTNISATIGDNNIFFCKKASQLSDFAQSFAAAILFHAKSICLILNSSVNSYRRLDPKYEAPNQIKISECDRSAMMRIPYGNKNSSRIEIRSVAPDSNPYLVIFTLLNIGMLSEDRLKAQQYKQIFAKKEKLPHDIYEALKFFKSSNIIKNILGREVHEKYYFLKTITANRSPKELGRFIKNEEIIHHHEITNQYLWNLF